ncbi:tetratricopeptide repeat protein [Sphingomonas sp. LHG3406-1]|uniref:tetratricopeptide repeat protein n=1 Tax=Sphingomonas sp. LHG3406-1 TaxID=2804617 RepID=UPI00262C1918|nr:tetratricopeptide repeat protein [Sphingomonas sp. LHG3406-1]
MTRLHRLTATAGAILVLSGCVQSGSLSIRTVPGALADGTRSAAFRVAEAQSYFAMGSIGLASEGFRRALREDPDSVDALNGLAACYDRMGRFDLSRGYYERALALAPSDSRLYANLATSLAMQGKDSEAAAVRSELAQLKKAQTAPSIPLAPAAAVATLSSQPVVADAATSIPIAPPAVRPARHVEAGSPGTPHLERVNLAEVMLVTKASTSSPPRPALAALHRPATPPLQGQKPNEVTPTPIVRLLNAARVNRLAASTREQLRTLGWRRIAIGNAPEARAVSAILYPEGSGQAARRLGRELGIDLHKPSKKADVLVVLLGRDKAGQRVRT